uniref:PH domain-containing protein n=1 Tax=Amorphochlora amoebiformis TaxID=1561963 RepID=A0A7S0H4D0_9EUKA
MAYDVEVRDLYMLEGEGGKKGRDGCTRFNIGSFGTRNNQSAEGQFRNLYGDALDPVVERSVEQYDYDYIANQTKLVEEAKIKIKKAEEAKAEAEKTRDEAMKRMQKAYEYSPHASDSEKEPVDEKAVRPSQIEAKADKIDGSEGLKSLLLDDPPLKISLMDEGRTGILNDDTQDIKFYNDNVDDKEANPEAWGFRVSSKGKLKKCLILVESGHLVKIIDEKQLLKWETRVRRGVLKVFAELDLHTCRLHTKCEDFPDETRVEESFYLEDTSKDKGVMLAFAEVDDFGAWMRFFQDIIHEAQQIDSHGQAGME